MASQLSKKAALPLAKILATRRNNVSNTGHRLGTLRTIDDRVQCCTMGFHHSFRKERYTRNHSKKSAYHSTTSWKGGIYLSILCFFLFKCSDTLMPCQTAGADTFTCTNIRLHVSVHMTKIKQKWRRKWSCEYLPKIPWNTWKLVMYLKYSLHYSTIQPKNTSLTKSMFRTVDNIPRQWRIIFAIVSCKDLIHILWAA